MTVDYSRQPVLVVGGFGYIGSNLTAALLDAGAVPTIVTPSRDRHAAAAGPFESRGARVIEADVRDLAAMQRAVEGQAVVFNASGRSGALASVQDPAGDLDVNVAGGLVLLEALRIASPSAKLVFAGTRLVYGAPTRLPVSEDHPVAPLCPHGLHKAAVEQYMAIYASLHGIRATCLRITNPYGPGQPGDRRAYGVINYLIHCALRCDALPIYGEGTQLRDYVFIGDVIEAMLLVGCDTKSDGRVYNIGSGVGTRLVDAARLIVEVVGSGRVVSEPWPPIVRDIDSGDFVADVTRIGQELGWRPTVALREGLHRTVALSLAASANS
jgi:UDP-glucose 4-epimerase